MSSGGFMQRVLAAGPRGRAWAALFLCAGTLAAALALPRLTLDRSDDRLISTDAPGWTDFKRMQEDFGAEQTLIVYLRAPDLWTEARLKQLQQFTFALEDTPGITAVSSLLSATNIRDKGDYVDAGPLATIVPGDPAKLAELRDDAAYSPIMRRNFISDDGFATAVNLSYESRPGNPDWELEVFAIVERLLEPLRDDFEVAYQIGRPRLNVEIDRGLKSDLGTLIPLALAILVVVITAFLKSLRVIPIPLVTATLSVVWTLGFMAATGIPITLLTAMIPALIIVIGAVEDVHLVASYLEGLDGDDDGRAVAQIRGRAIGHMARHVGLPVLITSLTTAIGFAANVITEIPLIFEFAIASAFAMVANFVVTLLAVPLLLQWFGPRRSRLEYHNGRPGGIAGMVVRVVEYVGGRAPVAVVAVSVIVVLWFGHQASSIRVNNDPLSYFPSTHPFVLDAERVHRDLAGLHVFSVILRADEPGYFRTPQGLKKIAAVQVLLDEQGLYDKTLSLASLLALMHREMHAGDPDYYRIANDVEDIDLYLSTLSRDDLAPFVTEDFATARISVRHNVTDSIALNAAVDALDARLPEAIGHDIDVAFTGKNLMVNRAAASLIQGQMASLGLILVIIFVLFTVLYTSWHAGLLALVPNLIPIIVNFGAMGWLGVPLNPGTAMVAAIAIGIAVDDTIHLMTRFGIESKRHVDERDAVRATVRGEAVPIISTSVALALGFAALGLSNFSIIAEFGLLAAATMIYAAIADLLLMPILLQHLRLATVWDIIALELDRDVLVNCPLFSGMSRFAVKKVVVLSNIEEFEPGSEIIEQGTVSRGMYVILKGTATISIRRDGITLDLGQIGPGDIVGEIGFSGDGIERTATVTAREPLTVVKLDAASAHTGLRFYPRIAAQLHRNISNVLGARLVESHQRLVDSVRTHND
ncbi:MAG: MMPL family transporter [Gammaproteobacteria bacterium]